MKFYPTTQNLFEINAKISALINELLSNGKKVVVEVKEYKPKRSLDANSYCWVIISKIADALRLSKEVVYISMLKDYGQREPNVVSVVEQGYVSVLRATDGHCVEVGRATLKGKEFIHFALLIGSSNYNTAQMAILIEGIIHEAQQLGIDTITENEKLEMLSKEKRC